MVAAQGSLRVSIITPSFNQGHFIERTIRSVLDQQYPNLDYLVIDGGSTDGTIDILKKYQGRFRWISEPDKGQSDAINKGLRMATGDILCYLNSDDMLQPGSLAAVAQAFQDHPESRWLTGYCQIIDEHDRPIQSFIREYKNFLLRHFHSWTLVTINYVSQMSTFWRRSAMEAVGLFSVEHHLVMDYDYWLRLNAFGPPLILRHNLSAFRLHQAAKSTNRFVQQFRQSAAVGMKATRNPLLKVLSWLHHRLVILAYQAFSLRS